MAAEADEEEGDGGTQGSQLSAITLPAMQVLEVTEHWLVDRYQAALFPVTDAALLLLTLLRSGHMDAARAVAALESEKRGSKAQSAAVADLAQCVQGMIGAQDSYPFCPTSTGMEVFQAAVEDVLDHTRACSGSLQAFIASNRAGGASKPIRSLLAAARRLPLLVEVFGDAVKEADVVLERLQRVRDAIVAPFSVLAEATEALAARNEEEAPAALAARFTKAVTRLHAAQAKLLHMQTLPQVKQATELHATATEAEAAMQAWAQPFIRLRKDIKARRVAVRSGTLSPAVVKQVNTHLTALHNRGHITELFTSQYSGGQVEMEAILGSMTSLQSAIAAGDMVITARGASAAAQVQRLVDAAGEADVMAVAAHFRAWRDARTALSKLTSNRQYADVAESMTATKAKVNSGRRTVAKARADLTARVAAVQAVMAAYATLSDVARVTFELEFRVFVTLDTPLVAASVDEADVQALMELEASRPAT